MEQKIKFKRILREVGNGSLSLVIPPEMVEYLKLKKGKEITLSPEIGKYGLFGAFYDEKQQIKEEE